jgi:hypothetical protein
MRMSFFIVTNAFRSVPRTFHREEQARNAGRPDRSHPGYRPGLVAGIQARHQQECPYWCGYVATTGVFRLDHEQFAEAIQRLAPAEAASNSTFLAFFIADANDPTADQAERHR